jgi:hypothetical protein
MIELQPGCRCATDVGRASGSDRQELCSGPDDFALAVTCPLGTKPRIRLDGPMAATSRSHHITDDGSQTSNSGRSLIKELTDFESRISKHVNSGD